MVRKYSNRTKGRFGDKNGPPLANRLNQAASADCTLLASGRPQFRYRPKRRSLSHFATRLRLRINSLVDEIRLEDTLQRIVLSAWFRLGIGKFYMRDSALVQLEENVHADPGSPFFGNVSFGRFFLDMNSLEPGEIDFKGDEYDVDWERLNDSGLFEKKVTSRLHPDKNGYKYDASQDGAANDIFADPATAESGRRPKVRLRDVYLPREKLLVTWPCKMDTPPLRVLELYEDDYDFDPYPLLWFDPIPDNALPVSPGDVVEKLHDQGVSLRRRLQMQAAAMKSVTFYEPEAAKTADMWRTAQHGQYCETAADSLEKIKRLDTPGPDANLVRYTQVNDELFDEFAGHLRAKTGGQVSAPTATGASLSSQAVGTMLAKKQYRVTKLVAEVGRGLTKMLMADKFDTREQYATLPGFPEFSYPAHWMPNIREGSPSDYEPEVIPYTLSFKPPEQLLRDLIGFVKEVGLPMANDFAASGQRINPTKLLELAADLGGMPELLEIYDTVEPVESVADEGRQSPVTTRQTIRRSEAASDPMSELVEGMEPAPAGA